MTTALADVLKPTTAEQAERTVIGLLDAAGFPATSWQPKSFPRTVTKAIGAIGANFSNLISNVVAGVLNGLSTGGWLDLLSEQNYANTRAAAVAAAGQMVLTNQTGVSQPITVGMWLADGDGSSAHRFEVTGGAGTLAAPNGSTLAVTVRAESPGAAYNIPSGASLFIAGGVLPGVTVSNPAIGSTGTWLTTAGADKESDPALQERNATKWADQAPAGNDQSYVYWARTAVPTITRVKPVREGGTVNVYLANAAGGATGPEVTAVDTFLQAKKSIVARVFTVPATSVGITLVGTIYVDAVHAGSAPAAALANLAALGADHDIGGFVYLSEIIGALTIPTGVRRVVLSSPTTDANLGDDGVPVFDVTGLSVVVEST